MPNEIINLQAIIKKIEFKFGSSRYATLNLEVDGDEDLQKLSQLTERFNVPQKFKLFLGLKQISEENNPQE